jgi:tetratricopeptide (TPR) repeat protein
VRKHWFAAWTIGAITAGCLGVALAAEGWGASPPNYGPVETESWTDKLTAPFKKNPFKKKDKTAPPAKPSQEVDPLSLAFKSGPTSPQLYVAMAEMAYRGGNADQARQLYQKALAMDAKDLNALLSAAHMEDREGKLDVAIGLYDRAVKAHPKNPTALNDLALCVARKGDLASANRILQQAIQIEPRKALYRNNAAKVLIEMNRLEDAAAHLSAVHAPAVTHYNMAVLLAERGRNDEATRAASLALATDPQMQPAQELLAQLDPSSAPAVERSAPVLQTARAAHAPPRSMPPQAAATMATPAPASDASILPTGSPEIPGFEPVSAPSEPWPGAAAPAAAAPTSAGGQPLLLPPVN